MANLGDMHINITWDSEPTEEAKNFIRVEVLKVLQETFQEASWFSELVKAEVQRELKESGLSAYMHQVPLAAQAELKHLREG